MLFGLFKREKPQPATKDSATAVAIKEYGGTAFAVAGGYGVTMGVREQLPRADRSLLLNVFKPDRDFDDSFYTVEEVFDEQAADDIDVEDIEVD